MAKQPKLICVEKLRPLNPGKDIGFLTIFRQALSLALESEQANDRKKAESEKKPEDKP